MPGGIEQSRYNNNKTIAQVISTYDKGNNKITELRIDDFIWILIFSATFCNISAISWRPVLMVEEAEVPGENRRPWTSNW
jgi:hypothetical protein